MPGSKKAKKDAKDTGGVVAAVTKHAIGKFGNAQGFASDTSNSSVHSPELAPAAAPSSANGHLSVSPMLDAGSPGQLIIGGSPPSRWPSPRQYGTSHTSHTSQTSRTSRTSRTSHTSLTSQTSHPISVSVSPPSAGCPPAMAARRPLSYHTDYSAFQAQTASPALRRSSLHSHYATSRSSAATVALAGAGVGVGGGGGVGGLTAGLAAMSVTPPLPHQPQPHFYGAPELDFDLPLHQAGMKPGRRNYHLSFDTLFYGGGSGSGGSGISGNSGSTIPGSDTVVTAGYEGGLEVHAVSKRGLEHLASLTGLRGGVYNAKILPWTVSAGSTLAGLFPLVAVVVHGPVLPQVPYADEDDMEVDSAGSPHRDGTASPTAEQDSDAQPIEYYQTSVEVYSLKTNERVCVLLEAPKIPLAVPITSPAFRPPPPTGAFFIKADAGNIVVSSALTGECWVYRQMSVPGEDGLSFRYVAKLWTTLQQSLKGASGGGVGGGSSGTGAGAGAGAGAGGGGTGNMNGGSMADGLSDRERARAASSASSASPASAGMGMPPRNTSRQQPVLALNGRWLAYCPATPSSQMSLHANVPVPAHGRVPGHSSQTPPQLPPTTAEVDLPHTESVVNKIMRDATQELISGAKWVSQQGWQAFNNYWKSSSSSSAAAATATANQASSLSAQQHMAGSPPLSSWIGGGGGGGGGGEAGQFPPTHGSTTSTMSSKEPGLVSVVDVATLGATTTVHPLATFTPPLGCSFVSFSPSGLSLFTASTKGDVQTVWDLMRIQYTKASPLQALAISGVPAGPRARQIAQFSRMTVARIVDVAWTKPNGERLAMVTERGTVHLLDLPSSAFSWPPPRRRGGRPQDGGPNGAIGGAGGAAGGARGAIGSVYQTTTGGIGGGSGGGGGAGAGGTGVGPAGVAAASSAVSYASSAFNTALDAARPLLARPRRSSAHVAQQSAGASIVDHASHGGKMIAAGISHSLGKTGNAISQLRHTGENRVSLPLGGALAPGPSCVVWITGKRHPSLFVQGDGLVRSFASRSRKKTSGQRTLHLSPNKDFRLPYLPDSPLADTVMQYLEAAAAAAAEEEEEYLDFTEDRHHDRRQPHRQLHRASTGNTVLLNEDNSTRKRSLAAPHVLPDRHGVESSIPQAEIESSAPYQPFYTDPRVSLYERIATGDAQDDAQDARSAQNAQVTQEAQEPECAQATQETEDIQYTPDIETAQYAEEVAPAEDYYNTEATPAAASPGVDTWAKWLEPEVQSDVQPKVRAKKKSKKIAFILEKYSAMAEEAPETQETWPPLVENDTIASVWNALNAERKKKKKKLRLEQQQQEEQLRQEQEVEEEKRHRLQRQHQTTKETSKAWAFGLPIAMTLVNTGYPPMSDDETFSMGFEDTRALPASAMERFLQRDGDNEQIVVTTRRRRGGGRLSGDDDGDDDEDGFFENDCEVLDFADQRV